MELLSDFHWHKTLGVSLLPCHFPFPPLTNFWEDPWILHGSFENESCCPGRCLAPLEHWAPVFCVYSGAPWAAGASLTSPGTHFLPSTHIHLLCHAFIPLFQSSRCPLSFSPSPTPLSFNSRKEFRTHLQRAQYQITPRHHYMSQCLKPSGWRRTPSDCLHTCVSVSTRLLKSWHWGGGGAGWGLTPGFMEHSREVPGFTFFFFTI